MGVIVYEFKDEPGQQGSKLEDSMLSEGHLGMILSSNDALVEWGIELFESYRTQATLAIDHTSETARHRETSL